MYDSPLFLFFIGSALLNLGLAVYGLRHRQVPGALAFGLAMFLFAFLPLAQAVNLGSSDLALKVIVLKLRVDVAGLGAIVWVVMLMQYAGYSQWITRRFLIALSIVPAIFLILNWTENPLFRSNYFVDQAGSTSSLHWTNGPLFWLGLIYLNALLLSPLFLLWRSYRRISPLSFQQTLALSISTVLPIVINVLAQVGFSPLQGVSFPFAAGPVMGLIVALAIFRYRIFAVIPIARSLLIESMDDGVLVLDTHNRIVDINPAMQKLIGSATVGQPVENVFANWPDFLQRFSNTTEVQTEITVPGEITAYFDLRISPLLEKPGRLLGRLIVVRDITRHKETEAALRASENNFRSVLESAPDAMLIVDRDGQIIFTNAQAETLFGYSRTELLNHPVENLMEERLHQVHQAHRANYVSEPKARSMGATGKWALIALRKDGTRFPVEISLSPLAADIGLVTIAAIRDMTERTQLEEQLHVQATALSAAAHAVVISDLKGVILWVNPAFTKLTGYETAEAIGQTTKLLRSGKHSQAFYENLWNTILSGQVWEGEIINRRKDGVEYFEYQTITPVRDRQDQITHFIAVKQDITQRKRTDEELQSSLKRLEVLYEVTRTGITAQNPVELLQEIVNHIAQGLPADRATLITFDLLAKKITNVVGGGSGANYVVRSIAYDELMAGLTGWAIRTGEVVLSPKGTVDPRESPAVQKRRAETNCGSIIVAPLHHQHKTFGTLTLINLPNEPDFTASDMELVKAIASQVSLAVDKITLEENLHRNNEQLSALNRTMLDLLNQRDVDDVLNAIIHDATRLLDAQYSDLDIVEDDVFVTRAFTENQNFEHGLRTPRGTSGSTSWQVYDTRQPVIVDDYAQWPQRNLVFEGVPIHATMILPLVSGSRCLGVFSLSRAEVDQPFTDNEVQLATLFAQQAALALDNAQLHASAQHEIEQRKQTEEALRSQNDYLAALHELTLGLINRLDLDSLLEVMLTTLADLVKTRHALIELVDPIQNVLVQKVAVGKYVSQNGFRTARGAGLTGRVWESGELLVISDYAAWEGRLPEYPWLRTVAGIPLKADGKVIGVIGVAYDEPERLITLQELDFLKRFANLASIALDNAQMFTRMARQSQELNLLHEVRTAIMSELDLQKFVKRTVEAITETFGYALVSLYLRDGDTLILQHQVGYDRVISEIPVTKGVSGRVIKTGQPVLIEDVRKDPDFLGAIENILSEVAIPIFDEDQIVGVLNIETHHPVKLTEADLSLMLALSEQISIAIGRARLYDSLQRNNDRLSLLHEIALELLKPLEMDALLQSITDQFVKLLDAFGGFVALAEGNELVDRAITPHNSSYQMVRGGGDTRKGPPWQVFESRQPLITDDYSSLPNIRPETVALSMKATLVLPILYGDNCLGVLAAARVKADYPFTEEDVNFGNLFAGLAAVAIDNAQLHETLRQESIRDSLTGLFNRRFMEESFDKELQRAQRNSTSLAVVMIDLDHLKTLNDTYGHELGDMALRLLGQLIKIRIRASDIACRYGGDEFTLILPEASLENARLRMEELREDVKQIKVQYAGEYLTPITLSIGITVFPEQGLVQESLLKAADEALYRAKRGGRDQVVTA
jgi:diguanylate cyclase (GGDEF)-like protein/PAS domain S-box-containing protein